MSKTIATAEIKHLDVRAVAEREGCETVSVSAFPHPAHPCPCGCIEAGASSCESDDAPLYLVSGAVLAHPDCWGRRDVAAPGTDPAHNPVRDERGNITAVRCLVAPQARYC